MNLGDLAQDITKGQGGHLSSLADFFSSLQANYETLSAANNMTELKSAVSATVGS